MGNKRKLRLSDHRKSKKLMTKRRLLERRERKNSLNENSCAIETREIAGANVRVCENLDLEVATDPTNFDLIHNTPSTTKQLRSTEQSIEGNRIVNVKHMFDSIISFKHCPLFSCSSQQLQIVKEKRKGLISEFTIECKMCKAKEYISSSNVVDKLNLNMAAVLGTVSIGCGYSQLTELLSTLDVPPISYRLYKSEENNLQNIIETENLKSMVEAGKMEAALARENGELDENGIPLITVIADGAWCKRSYRSAYNAHSGAACIVGQRTGKLLYLGIRNKFCAMCQVSFGHSEHLCFKNWSGTSTSMETAIIVEGFKSSLQMHGVKYAFLVGDGDSSVFRHLQTEKPYGNFEIQKIECSNHLLRNYVNNLKQLSTKKFSSRGQVVDTFLKKLLKSNIQRLRVSIDCAVKYRRTENVSFPNKVLNLKKDITNSISHVFGDHAQCDTYFCKGNKSNEVNVIPDLKKCGLFNDIMFHANRLVYNSRSLIKNMTNNNAECYNSVIAKFIGGKRIDFSKRGGYTLRCHAAGLSFNKGPEYHSTLHRALSGQSPGKYIKQLIRHRKQTAANLSCRRRLFAKKRANNRNEKRTSIQEPDEDYGDVHDLIDEEEYSKRKDDFLEGLKKTKEEISDLMENTKDQRESVLWIQERRKRITASMFGRICKLRSTTDPTKTARQMLKSFSSLSTSYGIDHEPTALKEFSELMQLKIGPCGLFVDETDCYLGATPDGLIDSEGIIEIKCPYSCRNLTPLEAIEVKKLTYMESQSEQFRLKKTHNYYYQIQGQLHVTGKEFCYFVVWTPKGLIYDKISRDNSFFNTKMKEKLKSFYFSYYLPEILKLEYK